MFGADKLISLCCILRSVNGFPSGKFWQGAKAKRIFSMVRGEECNNYYHVCRVLFRNLMDALFNRVIICTINELYYVSLIFK